MHFSAKRGLAIACRLSVCPSVRPSVTLVNCDHIGWNELPADIRDITTTVTFKKHLKTLLFNVAHGPAFL